MKNKNTIIIIDIVLVVIAIALGIFLVVLNNQTDEIVEQNNLTFVTEDVVVNIDDSLMSEYVSEILGIKFKYYKEYAKVSETADEKSMYKGAGMYKEEGNEGINVLVGNAAENITLDVYINANVNAIMEANGFTKDDFVIIKEGVKLGGVDAYKIRYKADNLNIYQIATVKDSKEYVVTYSAEDKYYDKQKAENMFSTFEFTK